MGRRSRKVASVSCSKLDSTPTKGMERSTRSTRRKKSANNCICLEPENVKTCNMECEEGTKINEPVAAKVAEGISETDNNASIVNDITHSLYKPQFETYNSDLTKDLDVSPVLTPYPDVSPVAAAILGETIGIKNAEADALIGDHTYSDKYSSSCFQGTFGERNANENYSDSICAETVSNIHPINNAICQTFTDSSVTSTELATGAGNECADKVQSDSIQFQEAQENMSCTISNVYTVAHDTSSECSQSDLTGLSEQSQQIRSSIHTSYCGPSALSKQSQEKLFENKVTSVSNPVSAPSQLSQVSNIPISSGMVGTTKDANVCGSQQNAFAGNRYLQNKETMHVPAHPSVTPQSLVSQNSIPGVPISSQSCITICSGQQAQECNLNIPLYSENPTSTSAYNGSNFSNTGHGSTSVMPTQVTTVNSHLPPNIQYSSSVDHLSPYQMRPRQGMAYQARRQSFPSDNSAFRSVIVSPIHHRPVPPNQSKFKRNLQPYFQQMVGQHSERDRGIESLSKPSPKKKAGTAVSKPSPNKKGDYSGKHYLIEEKMVSDLVARGINVGNTKYDQLGRTHHSPKDSKSNKNSSAEMVSNNQVNRPSPVPIATTIRNHASLGQQKRPEQTVDFSEIPNPRAISVCCLECNVTLSSQDCVSHTCVQDAEKSPRRPYKCSMCSAGFSTRQAQYSHYEHFHSIKMSPGDLAIPLVDLSKESIASSSFKNFLPLTNLPRVHGLLGAPILSFENLQEGILDLEKSINAFFYLGPVKSLNSVKH